MRHIRNPQPKLGEIRIDSIKLNPKSRDDIPALLVGLQFLYCNEDLRTRLFALLEEHICPGTNRKVGRPGMDMWRILVMGVIKQGLDCDYDRLHELVNEHKTLRQFLGHSDVWDDDRYEYQTVVDNVGHLSPALLAKVSTLVVEGGHAVARKKPGDLLARAGVIHLWSRLTSITPLTSVCCGMPCGISSGRRVVQRQGLVFLAGGNGSIISARLKQYVGPGPQDQTGPFR